jgi:hypothetical protein
MKFERPSRIQASLLWLQLMEPGTLLTPGVRLMADHHPASHWAKNAVLFLKKS